MIIEFVTLLSISNFISLLGKISRIGKFSASVFHAVIPKNVFAGLRDFQFEVVRIFIFHASRGFPVFVIRFEYITLRKINCQFAHVDASIV